MEDEAIRSSSLLFPLRACFKPSRTTSIVTSCKENVMLGIILLVILILLLLGALPAWPYSREWGYGPTGGLGLLLVIVLILVVMRVI
jgi:hypothetical protein